MPKNPVSALVYSRHEKQLTNRRVLFHLPERFSGYDTDSSVVIQHTLPPVSVALCPTCQCLRRCAFCSNTTRNSINRKKRAAYSPETFAQITKDLKSFKVMGVILAGGGEPLVYDQEALRKFLVDAQAPYQIGIHTNGVLLGRALSAARDEKSRLSYINVSAIAHTPELYALVARSKKSQFHQIESNIIEGIRLESSVERRFLLGVKILLHRDNYHFADELYRYFKSLGVSNILLRCVSNFEPGQDVALRETEIFELCKILRTKLGLNEDQIAAIVGHSSIALPVPSRCWIAALQYTAAIEPDGETYLCPPWSRTGYSIGNVNHAPLSKLWGADQHRRVAHALNDNMLAGRCDPLTCRHYYSNLVIDAFLSGDQPALPKSQLEEQFGRFI